MLQNKNIMCLSWCSKISHLDYLDLFLLAKWTIVAIFRAATSFWATYAL